VIHDRAGTGEPCARPARINFVARMRALLVLLLPLAALVALAAPSAPAAQERANVVLIMTDDQTLADMAALPQTQRLLGAGGATFNRAYVSYPLCCPSRATALTGQYAHNHGVRSTTPPSGGVEALDAERALPVWLRDAGYETIHVGKYLNGYGLRRRPTVPPGWTDWHGLVDKSTYLMWGYSIHENGSTRTYGDPHVEDSALYQTDVLAGLAVDAIEAHAGEDPFYLSFAPVAPHGELALPGRTTQPYIRPAPRHRGRFATLPLTDPAYDEPDTSDKPAYVRKLRRLGPRGHARIVRDFRARREALLAVDDAVAAVVAALRRTGELDETYVLFTSDNGFFQGEHRIPKGKYLAYEPSSHVPLLVRGPGIAPGAVSDQLVANTDLAPTILAATGAEADGPLDGRSLLPFARDPALRSARAVLHEGLVGGSTDRDAGSARAAGGAGVYDAVRTDRFLDVHWRGGGRELYDRVLDPAELQSVHADPRYAGVRRRLDAALRRLRHCSGAACLAPVRAGAPRLRR